MSRDKTRQDSTDTSPDKTETRQDKTETRQQDKTTRQDKIHMNITNENNKRSKCK